VTTSDQPLWIPSEARIAAARITAFQRAAGVRANREFKNYAELHRWSVDDPQAFWSTLWDECGVIARAKGERALIDAQQMLSVKWFPDARLNFAENLLRRRDDTEAIVFWGEDNVKRRLTYRQLAGEVSRVAQALRASGVTIGDRVAGFMPNMPEAVIAMLATASIGAIWSSCSPDFGVAGALDRFGQIEPKVLFCPDGYYYNGKAHDSIERVREIAKSLPSLKCVVVVPYARAAADVASIPNATSYADFTAAHTGADLVFEQVPFAHPLFIMFSSGTTGKPKCIVHGVGGSLLQHLKEHQLHSDIRRNDRVFYFTTCGWMMWNWLVSALASEATLILYDGSPFAPNGNILWDYAQAERVTHFGTSAKYLDAAAKQGLAPMQTHSLDALRAVLSTGSPLVPEGFDYVYRAIKRDVCLSSISGGTDIMGCFVLGNPTLPVWRGELQSLGLGMNVDVFDEQGRPVRGERGELVCTTAFPSMPVGFWGDADGSKYRAAYFERFPNVWCHGDFVEFTEHGGMVIYGRSDAVLNPGGVRIGTAEIYRQVEQLDEVVESIVIGQNWDNDVRVVLFVKLREGRVLDPALSEKIKQQIRANATPRHVPAKIVQVPDIPRTKSGKIVELAVRNIVHGEAVSNIEALANPQALDYFRARPELAV
jgi:acetoacetyl-CoA synthetase